MNAEISISSRVDLAVSIKYSHIRLFIAMPACPSVCLSGWTLRSRKHRMNAEISEISYERCDLGNYKNLAMSVCPTVCLSLRPLNAEISETISANERWDLGNYTWTLRSRKL